MNSSKLSYESITDYSQQLKANAGSMEDILSQVTTLFNKIGTDDVWSGTAASSAKDEFDTLSAKFPEFSKAINDCATYLDQVVAAYQDVDSKIMGQN